MHRLGGRARGRCKYGERGVHRPWLCRRLGVVGGSAAVVGFVCVTVPTRAFGQRRRSCEWELPGLQACCHAPPLR
jgi:hypothetical protein